VGYEVVRQDLLAKIGELIAQSHDALAQAAAAADAAAQN